MAWNSKKKTDATAIIADVPADLLKDVIMSVIAGRHSVTFSTTKDGSSISLVIYEGKEKSAVYLASPEEFQEQCTDLLLYLAKAK